MIITVEKVMALKPCEDWTEDRARSYLGDGVSPAELADILLRITPEDAYWLLARLLPPQDRVEWACRCAERVLPVWEAAYPDDDRPRRAIEAARSGDIAAYAAAHAAAYAAAYDAAHAAASDVADAAHAAAYDAAHAAASDAAEAEWQIREACRMLEDVE
jgi:hypothetical protein